MIYLRLFFSTAGLLIVISGQLLLLTMPFNCRASEGSFQLHSHVDGEIDIEAQHTPLLEILKALAKEKKIVLIVQDLLEEPVTISLKSNGLEETIQRLLARRNFAVYHEKTEAGNFIPVEIHVFGNKNALIFLPESIGKEAPESLPQGYSKEWYIKELKNNSNLESYISSVSAKEKLNDPEDPLPPGIIIERLDNNCIFSRIGLNKDDHIISVNGLIINSTKEFIHALKTLPDQVQSLRIERKIKYDKEVSPIYIYLN